jgi:hypothetical protein
MNPTIQRILVWTVPVLLVLLFGGFITAGWFPPPDPDMTARQVAHMYQTHTDRIRIACLMIASAGALFVCFTTVISHQMKRAEGTGGDSLARLQMACGAVTILLFTIPTFFWQAAAYRPDRTSIELTQALHDAGWIPIIGAIFPAIVQNFAIAGAAFTDKRSDPVFPRWLGYFNIWIALGFIPSGLVLFFKTGAFAWNGIFTFWLAATIFGIWFGVMVWRLLVAIKQEEAELAAEAATARETVPA